MGEASRASSTADFGAAPDPELIDACLRGDGGAWESLVRRYARLVYSVPRRAGLPEADRDDVVQTVFAALLRRLPSLRDRDSLAKWLITTTQRVTWRHRARSDAAPDAGDDGARATTTIPAPDRVAERWEQRRVLLAALDRLEGPCRDLLRALYVDAGAADYREISRRLGMPMGSIGPTRARCLVKLRALTLGMGLRFDDAM